MTDLIYIIISIIIYYYFNNSKLFPAKIILKELIDKIVADHNNFLTFLKNVDLNNEQIIK